MEINVPYAHRELAKQLGARWNQNKKTWVVPIGSDLAMIAQWLPPKQIEVKVKVQPTKDELWEMLPPRSKDPKQILSFLGPTIIPIKGNGFCGMCDSNCSSSWFIDHHKNYELRHLADVNINIGRIFILPSELVILLGALEKGEI